MTILFEIDGFTRKIDKVTGSQMTILFEIESFTRKIDKVTGSQMTILFEVESFTRKIYIKSQALRMTIFAASWRC